MQSTFFTDFLYLTDIKTILFIVVLFALFFVMKQMEKKKVKFSTRMLSATGIGLVLGLLIQVVGDSQMHHLRCHSLQKLINGMDYLLMDLWIY